MKNRPLLAFCALTFAITWGIAVLFLIFGEPITRVLGPVGVNNPLFWVAVFSPTISALLVTARLEGRAGVSRLLGRLVRWRFGIQYYLIVLIGFPILGVIVGLINSSMQPFTLAAALAFLTADPGPLGEELGWRGFALPRLLDHHAPLKASLILGVIWGVWHLPSFALSGLAQSAASLPLFLIGALALSLLATLLYRATHGSVLITVLMHSMVNMSIGTISGTFTGYLIALILIGIVALIALAQQGTRNQHLPAVAYQRSLENAS